MSIICFFNPINAVVAKNLAFFFFFGNLLFTINITQIRNELFHNKKSPTFNSGVFLHYNPLMNYEAKKKKKIIFKGNFVDL